MAIQIYTLKKNFDTQKAERYFKERRISYQLVDLTRARMGKRELQAVVAQVGLDALIDRKSKAFLESTIRFSTDSERIVEALCEDPRMLQLPVIRNGKLATVGYRPEVWAAWTE